MRPTSGMCPLAPGGTINSTLGKMMRRMIVLALTALLATACTGGSFHTASGKPTSVSLLPPGGSAKAVPHTPGTSGHPVTPHLKGRTAVVLNNGKVNVCSLITRGQISQIMAMTLPAPQLVPVGTFDECSTTQVLAPGSHAIPIRVAWAVPPVSDAALTFRQSTVNLPAADAVHGLGTKADCNAARPSATRLFVLDGTRFLEIFANSCAHAIALASIALPRL